MTEPSGPPWYEGRALAARSALDARDAGPALDLLAGARSDPELRAYVLGEVASPGEEARAALQARVHREPHDPHAWLLLGAALSEAARDARGSDVIEKTSEEQIRGLLHYTGLARDALHRAADLLPSDPLPWCWLLGGAMSAGRYEGEVAHVWVEVVRRGGGDLFGANTTRLLSLAGKWGGSEQQCFDFARERTRDLPPGHPLLALVPLAHVEALVARMMRSDRTVVRVWHLLRYLKKPGPRAEIDAASDRLLAGTEHYRHHPATAAAHQAFACAYHEGHAPERARPHLELAGLRSTGWPWTYFGEDGVEFGRARQAAGLAEP